MLSQITATQFKEGYEPRTAHRRLNEWGPQAVGEARVHISDTCAATENGPWLAPFASAHKDYAAVSPSLQSNFALYSEKERHLAGFFFPFHCPLPPCHRIWETQERRERLMPIGASLQHTTLSCRQLSAGKQNWCFPVLLKYYCFARLLDLSTSMANIPFQRSGTILKRCCVTAKNTSGTSASWV